MRPNLPYRKLLNDIKSGSCRDSDVLIGTPLHDNLGDHLITLSELCFLADETRSQKCIEIPLEFFRLYSSELQSGLDETSRIFVNGGGWMGDVWKDDELAIQEVVNLFPENQIIVFPQTVYYAEKTEESNKLRERSISVYDGHKNLTMFFRERSSYNIAKSLYKNVNVQLAPDIALYYCDRAPKRQSTENIIGLCIRNDKEAVRNSVRDRLLETVKNAEVPTKQVSTIYHSHVSALDRERVVTGALGDFASCGVVITDRLHAMLFCYLTDTPCVVFDNVTHKVSGVFNEWLQGSPSILPVFEDNNCDLKTIEEFISTALASKYKNQFSERKFDSIRSLLINGQD